MKKYFAWFSSVGWALLIWRLTTTPQIIVSYDSWFQNILMMGAHFGFFGVQAVLLRFIFSDLSKFSLQYSIILTSLYGALIEFRQLSVPGRSADPMDWMLDTLGAITFLFLFKKLQSNL